MLIFQHLFLYYRSQSLQREILILLPLLPLKQTEKHLKHLLISCILFARLIYAALSFKKKLPKNVTPNWDFAQMYIIGFFQITLRFQIVAIATTIHYSM